MCIEPSVLSDNIKRQIEKVIQDREDFEKLTQDKIGALPPKPLNDAIKAGLFSWKAEKQNIIAFSKVQIQI